MKTAMNGIPLVMDGITIGQVTTWEPSDSARTVARVRELAVPADGVIARGPVELSATVSGEWYPMRIFLGMYPWLEANPHSDVTFSEQARFFDGPPVTFGGEVG